MGDDCGGKPMTLDELVDSLAPTGDGAFGVNLADNWTQGRTAYGGITAALALAVTRSAFPDLPPLRSAQVAFIGPLSGRIEIRPSLLRRGRSATYVHAVVEGEAGIGATVTFIFADSRESAVSIPAPRDAARVGDPLQVPPQVMFAQNFDHWFLAGSSDLVDRFVRLKSPSQSNPEIELLAVADLLPPPALFNLPAFAPLSSMNWHIDLMEPARRSRDRRWRVKNVAEMHDQGLSTQQMTMWDGDGRPVASGRQLVALFG